MLPQQLENRTFCGILFDTSTADTWCLYGTKYCVRAMLLMRLFSACAERRPTGNAEVIDRNMAMLNMKYLFTWRPGRTAA